MRNTWQKINNMRLSHPQDELKMTSRKRMKSIVYSWADNVGELRKLYERGCSMIDEGVYNYREFRTLLIIGELDKQVEAGMIGDRTRIMDMLISQDREMSELGLSIIHQNREERLCKQSEK